MSIKRLSDRNLIVLENFILYITGCNENDEDSCTQQSFSPNELYQMAKDYIKEDHVDGKENSEDIIVTYGAESSFVTEDRDRKYPENVVVVADYGEEEGTKTVATIMGIENLQAVTELINQFENPYSY